MKEKDPNAPTYTSPTLVIPAHCIPYDELQEIRELEFDLVNLHNKAVRLEAVPRGFGREWEHGIHQLQMCLMAKRTLVFERYTECNNSPDIAAKETDEQPSTKPFFPS